MNAAETVRPRWFRGRKRVLTIWFGAVAPPRIRTAVVLLLTLLVPRMSQSADGPANTLPTGVVSIGRAAPDFSATDDQGALWKSADHVGQKVVVIWFYRADFVRSCTQQARRLQREFEQLRDRNVLLIGVSGDAVATHRMFKTSQQLDFTLLSDETGQLARMFGVRVTSGGTVVNPQKGQPPLSRKVSLADRVFAIDLAGNITFNKPRITTLNEIPAVFGQLRMDFWANREDKRPVWIPQLDRDWRRVLSRNQYLVTRKKQTEPKFSGRYCTTKTPGSYRCVGCGQVVFESTTKYDSGTGWPSFWTTADRKRIRWSRDNSRGTVRIEVQCNRCNAHLGHVFPDGPPPTRQRYCINSAALVLDRSTLPAKPGLPGRNK